MLIVLIALVWVWVATPAEAQPPPHPVTIVLNASSAGPLPAAAVANAWSQDTNLNIIVGDCVEGVTCIHLVYTKNTPCDVTDIGKTIGGCAYGPYDNCIAQVNEVVYTEGYSRWLPLAVATHEVGHCLGLDHNSYKGSIMQEELDLYETISVPSYEDRRNLYKIYRE